MHVPGALHPLASVDPEPPEISNSWFLGLLTILTGACPAHTW